MRKLLFTIVFGVSLAGSAWASTSPTEPARPSDARSEERVGEALAGWGQALAAGRLAEVRQESERLVEAVQTLGLEESEPVAAAVLHRGGKTPDTALRLQAADLAVRLAPSAPQTHLALASARFEAAPFAVTRWGEELWAAVRAAWASPRHRSPLVADAWIAFLVGFQVAAVVAWGVAALRHGRVVVHDLGHALPGRPPAWLAATLALGGLAAVAAWVDGWALPLLLGVALVWAHCGRQERAALWATLLLAALLPVAHEAVWREATWADTGAALLDAVDRRGDLSRVDELRAWVERPDAPAEALAALARVEARRGEGDAARALYERALALRPGWPLALVNLGNLEFAAGDWTEAGRRYEEAVATAPDLAAGWFGLSRVRYRSVEIGLGQEARDRALALDPSLVERYALGEDEAFRANRYLVDATLEPADLAALAVRSGAAAEATLGWWAPLPGWAAPWVGGLGALALLLLSPVLGKAASRACAHCGAPVCPRCDRRAASAGAACGPCGQVQAREAGLDPAARVEKELQMERHRRRRAWVARWGSALLLGPSLRGRAILGVAVVGVAVFAWVLGFGPGHPSLGGGWPLGLRVAVVGATTLGAVGVSIVGRGEEG